MDRGERRRRDEAYVTWFKKKHRLISPGSYPLPEWDRFLTEHLGLRKDGMFKCRCSKKTPGKPKLPRGACGSGMDRSPKIGRNRWRLDQDLFE